jgi:hypothetical protein
MKGKIICETAYEGVLAYTHVMGFDIKRLWIPEQNLSITLHENQLYVSRQERDYPGVVQEVDVPDEFVTLCGKYLELQESIKTTIREAGWKLDK